MNPLVIMLLNKCFKIAIIRVCKLEFKRKKSIVAHVKNFLDAKHIDKSL